MVVATVTYHLAARLNHALQSVLVCYTGDPTLKPHEVKSSATAMCVKDPAHLCLMVRLGS